MAEDNQNQRASLDHWIVAECPEFVIFKCFDSRYIQPIGVTRAAYFRFQLGVNDSEKQNNRATRIAFADTLYSLYRCAKQARESEFENALNVARAKVLDPSTSVDPFRPPLDDAMCQVVTYASEMQKFLDAFGKLLIDAFEGEQSTGFQHAIATAVKNVQTAIKENSRESKTGESRHPKRERGLQAIRIGMDYFSETLNRPNKKLIRSKLEALGMGFHGANKEQSWREFWSECGLENLPEDSELIGNSPK